MHFFISEYNLNTLRIFYLVLNKNNELCEWFFWLGCLPGIAVSGTLINKNLAIHYSLLAWLVGMYLWSFRKKQVFLCVTLTLPMPFTKQWRR